MGTKYQGTEAEVLALNTYIKVTRAAQSIMSRAMQHLADSNLSPSQFAILEALYHLGTLSQVELAQKLLLSTGNITTVIQNLENVAETSFPCSGSIECLTWSSATASSCPRWKSPRPPRTSA